MSLINKVAIVTGASSGIGAAIALKFAEEGAKVTLVGRNEKKLKTVAENCERTGPKPFVIADVTKNVDAKRIVNDTLKHFGKLDILINNAGKVGEVLSILDKNAVQNFDDVTQVNLRSAVNLTHLAGEHLIETKGNIVNISSIAARKLFGLGYSAYCTSKAALDHFSRSVALEFAQKGVRVNVINPGPVRTDIIENMGLNAEQAETAREAMKNSTLLNRVSEPTEIAELVLFLPSDKGVGITGSSLFADNGAMLR